MQALNEGRPAAITAGRQTDTAASANESAWPISTSSVWLSIGRRVLAGRSPDDATLCVIDQCAAVPGADLHARGAVPAHVPAVRAHARRQELRLEPDRAVPRAQMFRRLRFKLIAVSFNQLRIDDDYLNCYGA